MKLVPNKKFKNFSLNKYNLSRVIPEPVKREVRQRCGFGCVICGNAIYQYEHFDPEFADATVHDAKGITLLCGGCHDLKTRGHLSKDSVSHANQNPKALSMGFSWGPFDIGYRHPQIEMGIVTMTETDVPLRVFGDPLFVITAPQQHGDIFKISATLKNKAGNVILKIDQNEWQTPLVNWDCTVNGSKISIRSKARQIDLVIRVDPPNRIIIERLHMEHLGCTIFCVEGKPLKILSEHINLETTGATITNAKVGIDVMENSIGLGLAGRIEVKDLNGW